MNHFINYLVLMVAALQIVNDKQLCTHDDEENSVH